MNLIDTNIIQPGRPNYYQTVFSTFHGWGTIVSFDPEHISAPYICKFVGGAYIRCSNAELNRFSNN